jgi:hypothetical protein
MDRSISPESSKICPEAGIRRHAATGPESDAPSGGVQAKVYLRPQDCLNRPPLQPRQRALAEVSVIGC